jgi:hypothetical protein
LLTSTALFFILTLPIPNIPSYLDPKYITLISVVSDLHQACSSYGAVRSMSAVRFHYLNGNKSEKSQGTVDSSFPSHDLLQGDVEDTSAGTTNKGVFRR